MKVCKLAKSAQKVRNDQRNKKAINIQEPYVGKPIFKLREKNPLNYIHNSPFRFNPKTENERIREVS